METEFRYLSFDRIRYSMVWEGQSSVLGALQTQEEDEVLIICSGGCNVLNQLLTPCAMVWAVDLNPLQIRLLELKIKVIQEFPYPVYSGLLGFDGVKGMTEASKVVLPTLSVEDRLFWQPIFEANPEGLLLAGKLEAYICEFYRQLSDEQQLLMDRLFEARSLDEQAAHFQKLRLTNFEEIFVEYFSRQQLSNGRDPRLFRYTQDPGGERFFERLTRYLTKHLLGDSYISRFFFYGPENMPQYLRPSCYQEQHYAHLGRQFHRLRMHIGEAIDFLNSPEGSKVTKASLSNIFEYTSPEIFKETVEALLQRPNLRFVYWNLLNKQGHSTHSEPSYLKDLSNLLSEQEDCFYFDALHVFKTE